MWTQTNTKAIEGPLFKMNVRHKEKHRYENNKNPFRHLELVFALEFLLIAENIPKLLSMREMINNALDISLKY